MKKCPKGLICIENWAIFFTIICATTIIFIMYNNVKKQNIIVNNNTTENRQRDDNGWFGGFPSWPYNNMPNDVLLNPYAPPLRDERYLMGGVGVPRFTNFMTRAPVPINISTNVGAVDTTYRQLGLLRATNVKGKVLPLLGRPLFTNRDKWQYYTMSDQNNSIKMPISRAGKSCTNEYGCDKLYTGDTVFVEGLNEPYAITVYDNDTIKYLPFL